MQTKAGPKYLSDNRPHTRSGLQTLIRFLLCVSMCQVSPATCPVMEVFAFPLVGIECLPIHIHTTLLEFFGTELFD